MATEQVGESRDVGTLLQGERQVLEMIAAGAPLAAVLDALCCVIDQRSALMSAVFLVDGDGTRLTQAAGPHLPEEWRRATISLLLTPAMTSCGAAVTLGEQVIVPDVISDPLFQVFREPARAAGIGAAWSTPFYARDRRVLGTFAVFSPAAGPPRQLDLQLVERAAHLASIAVERHHTEAGLDASISQRRALAGRLMHAQDDERRRIAQILHETTAQDLAALKMHLARLNRTASHLTDTDRGALTESIALAEQSITEIRTLSYLLHPPFLDEMGLLAALRWYAAGFAERSGIKVDLELPGSFERLPLDTETALFRIVQESLINIHRHAGSEIARIRLCRDAETLVLEIEDRGHGIPSASPRHIMNGGDGVGIAGMCERLEQLGGSLEIESGDGGTTVRARLPLVADAG